jgi:hypothetical protein
MAPRYLTVLLAGLAGAALVQAPASAQSTSAGRAAAMTIAAQAAPKPRDLDTHHLFTPPGSREAWEARKKELRQRILFSAGLWPMPKKTPLNPRVTGKIVMADYTVENVALETLPGFYLCGNLYRPKGRVGRTAAIVNPHGHWANGRLEMQPDVPIASPPPAAPADGRGNLVSIGVNLAKQGFVVFAYDAVGYNDTRQVDHKFANGLAPWIWGVSEMGLQLWDSIRVVDYLQSLPDVDKNRIGVTGASGGGSQTFLLTAVDDRIKAAVPVNMVSAYMQGGCLCENGPGLRVGTDNAEVAAMFAPKPLLLVACTGDWTSKNPVEEWPAIRRVYNLYDAAGKTAVKQFNYQHNYNVESREAMYAWFGKWLMNDPDASHFKEKEFTADVSAMRVWNDKNPLPSDALGESALTESMIRSSRELLAELWPTRPSGMVKFREAMQPALEASLASSWSDTRMGGPLNGKPVTLVVAESSDQAEAAEVAKAIKTTGAEVESVAIGSSAARPDDMWGSYFSCYNATPAGVQVQRILERIAETGAKNGRTVNVVGVGKAGRVCLLARALTPYVGSVAVDLAQIDSRNDAEWLAELYAPGLRRAGDLQTAAMLVAPARLFIHNTAGKFTIEPVVAGYEAVGAALRADHLKAAPGDIAAWLSSH